MQSRTHLDCYQVLFILILWHILMCIELQCFCIESIHEFNLYIFLDRWLRPWKQNLKLSQGSEGKPLEVRWFLLLTGTDLLGKGCLLWSRMPLKGI